MPTRTVNLKMVLGRKESNAELRRALWTTHTLVNQAVASIERILLLCRGAAYWTLNEAGEEVQISEGQVVADALELARNAQLRNGKGRVGSDEEVLQALRLLYEQLVPSCRDEKGNPLKGDAKRIGAGYAGPLLDPDTCLVQTGKNKENCGPFNETASKKMEDLPFWIRSIEKDRFDKGDISQFRFKSADGQERFFRVDVAAANEWFESDTVQAMISGNKHFNKDTWKKTKDRGDNAWAALFARKHMELSEDPRIRIRTKLWEELGLLPIGSLFFDKRSVSNKWNRLVVRLAVGHFLSWESWNHETRKKHGEAQSRRDELVLAYQPLEPHFNALRAYERDRHMQLKQVAFADDARPFRIGRRSVRSWDRVREQWVKNGDTREKRMEICKNLQTKLRGKFGDPDLFRWLAEDSHEALWRETDSLTPLVKLNIAERLLAKRKKYALMTFADARVHPRWAMYEAPDGTNLRKYAFNQTDGALQVRLQLLTQDAHGLLTEREFTVRLAPSGQLSHLKIEQLERKEMHFTYRSAHQDFAGTPDSAELLFHRPYVEHPDRTEEQLSHRPGPVWFKLSLDVHSQAPDGWVDGKGRVATPPEVHHFNTALANKSKHVDKLKPGLRVLSVDLGLRTFASCAVFELMQGKPSAGLCFPAADGRAEDDPEKLWARHERSFKLTLPGETPRRHEEEARGAAMAEIRSIRRDIGRLRDILRLSVTTEEREREARIGALLESFAASTDDSELGPNIFEGLDHPRSKTTPELWQDHCQGFYDKAEKIVSARFSRWRKRTRPRPASCEDWHERREYAGHKSMWMVEYLDWVQKLIKSWNLRGRTYGEVNRQDRKKRGTVASRLLRHINKLKEDRTKSGADLIVQAARGFVPAKQGNGWDEKHKPCRLILFEDLARYRFKVDRPRKENSRLMKWSHRQIVKETEMQAQIYGITVKTTMAGFSSRYLAANGAPGVRCRHLNADDFEDGLPKHYVVNELDWMVDGPKNRELDDIRSALNEKIQPGMLVPWSGGELFATVKREGREKEKDKTVHIIQADINAAQNLQRRFWSRCGEAFRIDCRRTSKDGTDVYELGKEPGLRLLGALQQLENGKAEFQLVPDSSGRSKHTRFLMELAGGKKRKLKSSGDDSGTEDDEFTDALAELEFETDARRETFFRDPSGIFFNRRHWVPSIEYWSSVRQQVWKALKPEVTS